MGCRPSSFNLVNVRPTLIFWQAIIEMKTGVQFPPPLELPFSQDTNQEQQAGFLLSMLSID
jgi:hypothetical protein